MENINELILQARCGNDEAFSMLCDQYSSLIDSLSSKYSVMCADEYSSKDDFVQEAKMAFYNAVVSYDTSSVKVTFGAYAKVCIRNRLVSCVRKHLSKKRRKSKEDAQAQENTQKHAQSFLLLCLHSSFEYMPRFLSGQRNLEKRNLPTIK